MRRRSTVALLAALTVMTMTLGATAAQGGVDSAEAATPPNPFVGAWETFDDLPDDSSRISMAIGNTGTLRLRDEAASGCRNGGFGFVPATLTTSGEFDLAGDPPVLEAVGDLYCYPRDGQGRTLFVAGIYLRFEYHADNDVLIGTHGQATCWSRVGSGDPSNCD